MREEEKESWQSRWEELKYNKFQHVKDFVWDKKTEELIKQFISSELSKQREDVLKLIESKRQEKASNAIIKSGLQSRKKPCNCEPKGFCWRCAKMCMGEFEEGRLKAFDELSKEIKDY